MVPIVERDVCVGGAKKIPRAKRFYTLGLVLIILVYKTLAQPLPNPYQVG